MPSRFPVGIWLGHARHGFDWSDPEDLAAQRATVGAVDALSELWTGSPPADRAPELAPCSSSALHDASPASASGSTPWLPVGVEIDRVRFVP